METLQALLEQIVQLVGGSIPRFIAALAVLVVGWVVALIVSAVVRAALRRAKLDKRIARWVAGEGKAQEIEVERWTARAVFYLIMVFVLVAFFQTLALTVVTEPLNLLLIQLFQYAPRLLGAGLLLLLAWILARVLRFLVSRVLRAAKVDERLGDKLGLEEERVSLTQTLATGVYWLVFLMILPAVFNALALNGLLVPVQGMIDKALEFLPNIFAAGLILVIGWFVARIVQRIVTNVLVAIGADRLSERVGLARGLGERRLSGLLGLVMYVLILVPVLIAALDALALDAITRPAAEMLDTILTAIPAIFAACLVLAIAYVVGRVVSGLVVSLLASAGFDTVLVRLGLGKEPSEGKRTPSQTVGYLVLVGLMLFASIEALRLLGFEAVATLVTQFIAFAGRVILGLIIFGLGLYISNLAATAVRDSRAAQARLLALGARGAILVLAGAMALREMGLANEIISLAFGLLLGAIAVAVALAFGLGGREVAARELDGWLGSIKSKED
jgi:hypothetical protein